jgi:transketolase
MAQTTSSFAPPEALRLPVDQLRRIAAEVRGRVVATSGKAQVPHLGSCLSCIDILVAAYFHSLRLDVGNAAHPLRDRFILSKGHAAPALFQVLAQRGFYPLSDLDDYGADDSVFAEHPPTPTHLQGVEAATGSLGHGLPLGLGMALAGRIQKQPYQVVALLSDGECNEGSVWEAAMMAAAQRVGRLCVVIDFNKWQATGRSREVLALDPLVDKWRAFGWDAREIDGHDMTALAGALAGLSHEPDGQPVALIAHTVKGKGVSFMEDDNNWHYRTPTAEEVAKAHVELGLSIGSVA